MNEEDKSIIQMLYHSFCDDWDNFMENLKKSPEEKERIEYGLELIKADAESKEESSMYSTLWIAYYLGAGFGLELAMQIEKGGKTE